MTDEQFWAIIARAQGAGEDEAHAERLAAQLDRLNVSQILAFAVIYDSQLRLADNGPVWAAGVLLNGGHGSDDGFLDFRHWLIGQGRSIYSNALSNPDSLASKTVQIAEEMAAAEWEIFGATADRVYQSKSQRDLYKDLSSQALQAAPNPEEWEWSEYDDAYMRKNLPKLWARYGQQKLEFDKRVEVLVQESQALESKTEVEIAGLGILKAGVVLIHRKFGSGTILGVAPNLSGVLVTIKFSDRVRHMQIDSDTQRLFSCPNSISQ